MKHMAAKFAKPLQQPLLTPQFSFLLSFFFLFGFVSLSLFRLCIEPVLCGK